MSGRLQGFISYHEITRVEAWVEVLGEVGGDPRAPWGLQPPLFHGSHEKMSLRTKRTFVAAGTRKSGHLHKDGQSL